MSGFPIGRRVFMDRRPLTRREVMQNALDPNRMTAAERLAEIGEILAAGLRRLRAREQETFAGRPPEPTKARRLHNRWRLAEHLPTPARISVRPQGRYTEIIGYEFATCSATSAAARPAASAGSIPSCRADTPGSGYTTSAPWPARTFAIGGGA